MLNKLLLVSTINLALLFSGRHFSPDLVIIIANGKWFVGDYHFKTINGNKGRNMRKMQAWKVSALHFISVATLFQGCKKKDCCFDTSFSRSLASSLKGTIVCISCIGPSPYKHHTFSSIPQIKWEYIAVLLSVECNYFYPVRLFWGNLLNWVLLAAFFMAIPSLSNFLAFGG